MTDAAKTTETGTGLKLAIDFGPLLAFFIANSLAGVFTATAAFMAATAVAMLVSKMKMGRVSPMLWLSGVMVLGFGGLTLWLHNETFIKVKPTIVYVMFASILFFGLIRSEEHTSELQSLMRISYAVFCLK